MAQNPNLPEINYADTIINIENPPTPENIANPDHPPFYARFQLAYHGDRRQMSFIDVDALYAVMMGTFDDEFRRFSFGQRQRIRALLTVTNQNNNSSTAKHVHVFDPFIFAPLTLTALQEQINTSGQDVDPGAIIYEFAFSFNSYARAAGPGKPAEGWVDLAMPFEKHTIAFQTETVFHDDVGPLNCIAVALAYWMVRCRHWNPPRGPTAKPERSLLPKHKPEVLRRARQLMQEFVWHVTEPVSILQDFVEKYKSYRIILFQNQNRYVDKFQGENWVSTVDPNNRYLCLM